MSMATMLGAARVQARADHGNSAAVHALKIFSRPIAFQPWNVQKI
jgi:hypothetical protein